MTEQTRIDRETLLRRAAAAAGAVYAAPVLTSAAAAEVQGCPTFLCKNKTKRKQCRKTGQGKGQTCDCNVGERCGPVSPCPCTRQDPEPCSFLELCPGCNGNGGCFQDAKRGGSYGVCVDIPDFCGDLSPCDAQNNCPPGQACFNSCCGRPLCLRCCSGNDAAPTARPPVGTGSGQRPYL